MNVAAAEDSASKIHPALFARAASGPVKAWVFFTDKVTPDERAAALAACEAAYPERALERRRLRRTDPGLVDVRDLPVRADHISRVNAITPALRESRWANGVSVRADLGTLERLAELSCVRALQPVRIARSIPVTDVEPEPGEGPYSGRDFYGRSTNQLGQIGLRDLHARGFTGAGVVVGILDTGFNRVHTAFNNPNHPLVVVAEHDFINNDANAGIDPGDHPDQHTHGTLILGCIAAHQPDELVGGAYDASVILCKTEDITSETPIEEDNYAAALEFIEFHGGDVATSSLGYIDWYTQADLDGLTAITTIAVNAATANGLHCCTAAGNDGHDEDPLTSHLIAPADAPRVITCGAGRSNGNIASFSSDGPTADGRLKPEVLARGQGTSTVDANSTTEFAAASGTSLSTPLVAAAVACIVQAHPDWTVDQLRAALFATASDQVANGQPDPLFVRGHGFVDADAAAGPGCDPDVNCDGSPDQGDVACLILTIAGDSACFCPSDPDFNLDGSADQGDIAQLIRTIAGAPCP